MSSSTGPIRTLSVVVSSSPNPERKPYPDLSATSEAEVKAKTKAKAKARADPKPKPTPMPTPDPKGVCAPTNAAECDIRHPLQCGAPNRGGHRLRYARVMVRVRLRVMGRVRKSYAATLNVLQSP